MWGFQAAVAHCTLLLILVFTCLLSPHSRQDQHAQEILWESPIKFLATPSLLTVWEITLAVTAEDSFIGCWAYHSSPYVW